MSLDKCILLHSSLTQIVVFFISIRSRYEKRATLWHAATYTTGQSIWKERPGKKNDFMVAQFKKIIYEYMKKKRTSNVLITPEKEALKM